MRAVHFFLLGTLLMALPANAAEPAGLVVEDIFGRRLNAHGLTLVDWEGYIANPAIKFYVEPPADAVYPAKVLLRAKEPRLYFDLPSTTGAEGPRKEIIFAKREKVPVYVSIFPDRDGKDEDHVLEIEFSDAKGRKETVKLPMHVIDQDKDEQPVFPIAVDFSQDRTGFFKDEKKRQVVSQAANDWAWFLADLELDPVPAGKEKTFIWDPDGFKKGKHVTNAKEYTGYLLYAYGIQSSEVRSGGEPSRDGGLQTRKGKPLSIRRSGGLEMEVLGNYNKRGWLLRLKDGDWWKATNLANVENDLYSIAHHEIGHSLFFNPANPLFGKAKSKGKLEDAAVAEYFGGEPKIDKADHFQGSIDPASRRGTFGFEYHGETPQGRWLITKFDLLCAQAVGYRLRATSAFALLELQTDKLPPATVGKKYEAKLKATGGIPFYNWEVTAGALPDGLTLDSFSGEISGTPTKSGQFQVTVQVRDYDEKGSGKKRPLAIEVAGK